MQTFYIVVITLIFGQANAVKDILSENFLSISTTCSGCGAYLKEDGSCGKATLEDCGPHEVPDMVWYARQNLKSACKPVKPGQYFKNEPENCFPTSGCSGCGVYQDEAGQESCKVGTPVDCPEGEVPGYTSGYTKELRCKKVDQGYIYKDSGSGQEVGYYDCYPKTSCDGCGIYQDELGQTKCKVASVEDCGPGKVPKFAYRSKSLPCKDVGAGKYFMDQFGYTSSDCYPVKQCEGCGMFQDLNKASSSCKKASCSAGDFS